MTPKKEDSYYNLTGEQRSVIYGLLLSWVSACSDANGGCSNCMEERECIKTYDIFLNWIEEKKTKGGLSEQLGE